MATQAVDIVIKNGAGTPVDKTFTLLSPSAGYKSVAEWALREGAIASIFPRITAQAAKTNNNSQKMTARLWLPSSYTDTVTGLTQVGSAAFFAFSSSIPTDFPESLKNDYAAFCKNLVANSLMNAMIRDALPAT